MTARTRVALLAALSTTAFLLIAGPAAANSPWWHLTSASRPTNLQPEAKGDIVAVAANLGTAAADGKTDPIVIEDKLPPGLKALSIEATAGQPPGVLGDRGPVECVKTPQLTCTFGGTLPTYDLIEVRVKVEALAGAESGELNEVSVSGGGAPVKQLSRPISLSEAEVPFGLEAYELGYEEAGGGPITQAGSHPFQQTVVLTLNQDAATVTKSKYEAHSPALAKDVHTNLPPGFVGDPIPFPTCSLAQFLTVPSLGEDICPADTAVGATLVTVEEPGQLGLTTFTAPVFNLEPAFGEPARFGFVLPATPIVIDTAVRSGGPEPEYNITASATNISQTAALLSSIVTFWGVPGDPRHDEARGFGCQQQARELAQREACKPSEAAHPPAFLRLPTSCAGPLQSTTEIDSWLEPHSLLSFPASPALPTLDGCNQLPFAPTIHSEPTSNAATSPTGLSFDLNFSNEGLTNAQGNAESDLKKAAVTLPEGFTINASLAEGLGVCSEAQYQASTLAVGSGCPETSKVGEVEAESPLVKPVIHGSLYVAEQQNNPYHNLTTLYLVLRNAELGILVKQALKVTPDPQTGRLITEVDNIPQLPFSHLRIALRQGQRAPLITPPACGTFTVEADLYPWSNPSAPVHKESSFKITEGPEGKPCPQGAAPFRPGFEAGSLNNQAGSYSPFVLHITRKDGEQDITKLSSILPPGMVGKIAGVAKCPQASVEAAKHISGRRELASPSCPASSQIGTTRAGAGVGSTLVYVGGKLYLGGPYHGDPLSVVAIVPAVAGPFDVGDVVVQEALTLNPVTAEVEVDGSASDPLPHSLAGIPLNVRDIRVFTDRPNFTLNPTSCEESSTRATLWGGGTALFPTSETPVGLRSRFQAAGCASLGFKPKLKIKLKGGTKRGGHPALKAIVTPRKGDANFSRAVVTLPHSAFLDQAHIRTICTRVQFNANGGNGAGCPSASIYGRAKAWSPLLEEALEGPVFLRSSNHNLPDLVVALHGLVNIDLDSRIDSVKGGIRSTFAAIPDAPVSRFVLEMQGAKKGLIVNSTDICRGTHKADAELRGQNGKLDEFGSVVGASCGGKGKKGKGKG